MKHFNMMMTVMAIMQLLICSISYAIPMQAPGSSDESSIPSEDVLQHDLSPDSDAPPSEINDESIQTPIIKLKHFIANGMYNSALETISNLSKEERNKPDIIGLKAAALIGKNNLASAMNEYNLLKNRTDTTGQHFSIIADMLLRKKKPFVAMMVCQSGLMRNIHSARLLYQMGYAYDSLGKTKTALAYYKGAESANNVSPEKQQKNIERAIAVAYYKLNNYEKAKNAFQRSDLKDAGAGVQLIINAKYNISKGNYDKAISLLDKARESSRYLAANLTKAQVFILDSRPNEAIDLLTDLDINLSNSNFSDMLNLTKALAYLTNGNAKKSLDLLDSIGRPEKIHNLHMLKAITYFSMNKKKNAIEELKQTSLPYNELAAVPGFEKNLNQPAIGPDLGLAVFCLDQKFYSQALSIAKKSKNNIFFKFILAECYLQTEKFSLAIKELLTINETFKGSYATKFFLSQAYAKAGMIVEAKKTYKSLTEERPDFVLANLVYGKLLSDFSKWEEAKRVYENGLNFAPDSPHLQISLGWVLAYLNEADSLENLLQIIEKNEKIKPAIVLHLKGWSAFKNNDFSKAEEWLTKAIETAPGDPEICFHLGMTLMKSGKKDMAKNLLQQSLLFKKQRDRYQDTINMALVQKK